MAPVDATSIVDQLAVRALIGRLACATDRGTVEDYLACFADDATLELDGQAPRRGRDELEAAARRGRDASVLGPGSASCHMVTPIEVTLSGSHGAATTRFMFLTHTTTAPIVAQVGLYRDQLRRDADAWRIIRRVIERG